MIPVLAVCVWLLQLSGGASVFPRNAHACMHNTQKHGYTPFYMLQTFSLVHVAQILSGAFGDNQYYSLNSSRGRKDQHIVLLLKDLYIVIDIWSQIHNRLHQGKH